VDERRREDLASSFGGVAAEYARSRPTYPVEAVRWMVGSAPRQVLDLGAGTGRLTEVLVAEGHRVLAVDPSVPMLSHVAGALTSAVVAGRAEQVPVGDGVLDAVVVGQAFHWFDRERAVAEAARVLRPGGVMALVWNQRDESVPWVRRLGRVIGAEPDLPDPSAALGLSGAFRPVETCRFRTWQRLDRQRLLDLATSRSYVATLAADERERVLTDVGALYDANRGDALGLQLPYETLCFRALRR
jgi:SAM-dependent methyltransferase